MAHGLVTVPVTVVAGEETVVHLEGGGRWPNPQVFNQSNAVRLPNGEVVGWKTRWRCNKACGVRPRPQQRAYARQFSRNSNDLANWTLLRPGRAHSGAS